MVLNLNFSNMAYSKKKGKGWGWESDENPQTIQSAEFQMQS